MSRHTNPYSLTLFLIEHNIRVLFSAAYKKADGIKVDGKRLVVDYERGRTQKTWLPRRLGGGKGDTRKTREAKSVIEEREIASGFGGGYEDRDRERSGSRDRRQDSYRNGGGNDRDRRESSGGFRDNRGGGGGFGGGLVFIRFRHLICIFLHLF